MPIGVPRQLDHVPAVHPVAFVQELRIALVPDQRQRRPRSRRSCLRLLAGTPCSGTSRRSAPASPGSPHVRALLVVEPALVDGRAGHRAGDLSTADVVGMEVSDHDPVDRPVQLLAEESSSSGSASPVSQQPSLVPLDHVTVDVPGPAAAAR